MADGKQLSLDRGIFEPAATVRALRDARYTHPANAIAELIDNSIDANARRVELLIEERAQAAKTRTIWRVHRLAVVDNGHGMDAETLVQALRVGGRKASRRVHAIGKYGMGLPTASASQCTRVDVWTWQESIDNVSHSWLDVNAIGRGTMIEIPIADSTPVPEVWLSRVSEASLDPKHGTLVVWSEIDRMPQRAQTLFVHVERQIGRTYRQFIDDSDIHIRLARFRGDVLEEETAVRPNDPLFLMPHSATSEPWQEEPMFRPYCAPSEYTVSVDGREETVEVRYSIVRNEVITGDRDEEGQIRRQRPGARDHGKDAQRNMGVSIMRAGRELLLDSSFLRVGSGGELAMHRWWGCEIRFGAGLDEVFGVDHNKQMAAEISTAARALDTETLEELGTESSNPVYGIVADIRRMTQSMLRDVGELFKERNKLLAPGSDSGKTLTPAEEAEEISTEATREKSKDPNSLTETDIERAKLDDDARQLALKETLVQGGASEVEAQRRAAEITRRKVAYAFDERKIPGDYMFSVESSGGVLVVSLNIDHELYEFMDVLERHSHNDLDDPWARRAAVAIRTLLLAWARLEDGVRERERRRDLQRLTAEWGEHAAAFLPQVSEEMTAYMEEGE